MKFRLLLAALLCAGSTSLFAQAFPAKPVRIVIALAAGSTPDTLARGLAEPLSQALGQPVIVENRVGADGIIGTEHCIRAQADGHTLCATQSNVMVWNPVLRPKIPYDVLRDLAPVVHAGFFDSALLAHPSLPVRSVQQLFDHAKANPGKVNWGHFGVNSTGYMYQEWFRRSRGIDFYPVPYKTNPQAIMALVSGESQVGVNSIGSMVAHIKAGKVRPLAVTSEKRIGWLPDVPTFEELGIKLPLRTWFGYHYQAAVPKAIVNRMNAEIRKVMDTPDFRTRVFDRLYMTPNLGSPEEFDAFIRAQLKEVRQLVQYLEIKVEE